MSDAYVDYLYANHEPDLVTALVRVIDGRVDRHEPDEARPGGRLDPYPLIWATPEMARDTFGMAAPATERWLIDLTDCGDLGPTVLDVGCGMGVQACFLAESNPGWQVTGIDRCAQGIDRARELAQKLEIPNTKFKLGDIAHPEEALSGSFDSVLSSLAVGDWVMSEWDIQMPNPWSIAASCHQLLEDFKDARLDPLAHSLRPGGQLRLLERCGRSQTVAVLVAALNASGLVATEVTAFRVPDGLNAGGGERLVKVVALKVDPKGPEGLWEVLGPLVWDWEPEELQLALDPPVERLVGSELEVEDLYGHGLTRLECLVLRSGTVAVLMSTSRHLRDLVTFQADQTEEAVEVVNRWLEEHEEAPDVISMRPLGDEPVPQSRPDLLDQSS